MKAWDAPFEPAWIGPSLDIAGLGDIRPDLGTYGHYALAPLPLAPDHVDDFEWLRARTPHRENIGISAQTNATALRKALETTPYALPSSLEQVLAETSLLSRIRSCTDCYFDLGQVLARHKFYPGVFVRILSDSQCCVLWYLYIEPKTNDHCIVASPCELMEDASLSPPLQFVANRFSDFLWHFCLENEAWFAGYEKVEPSEASRQYIETYRARARAEASFPEQVRLTTRFDSEHARLHLSIFVVGDWAAGALVQISQRSKEPIVRERYDGIPVSSTRLASSEGPPVLVHLYALEHPPRYLPSLMRSLPSGSTCLLANVDEPTVGASTIIREVLNGGDIVVGLGTNDPRSIFAAPDYAVLLPVAGNAEKDAYKAASNAARAMLVVMSSQSAGRNM